MSWRFCFYFHVTASETLEFPLVNEFSFVQGIPEDQPQDAESVNHAINKAGRGCFGKITYRDGYFGNPEFAIYDLSNHFLIKNKAVRIRMKINCLKHMPAESSIAGMVF